MPRFCSFSITRMSVVEFMCVVVVHAAPRTMDSFAIADSMDRAAELLAQAVSEVYVGDEAFNPLADVKWLGRVALFWATLPWFTIVTTLALLVVSVTFFVLTHQTSLLTKFDDFVTRQVLNKMRQKLAGDVRIGTVKLRPTTVTICDFQLGNPPTAAFAAPFLVAAKTVHCALNPLSMLGVKGRGNFVLGYLCGEIATLSVTGATVYVDEVADPAAGVLSAKKIRNFQNLRRQSSEDAALERAREEAALVLLLEEKRIAEMATNNLKQRDPNLASLFATIGDSFASASSEIEKQLAEVNKQASSLGSAVAGGVQAAGADVTNKLNALINLLERVNQKPVEESEDEKRRKRKLTLELQTLQFCEWEIFILAVNKAPFKFRKWELQAFKGGVGALARECASGLLNEIINDFQHEILTNLSKDIAAVGDGLLNVGAGVVGGGAFVVGLGVSSVGAVGQGLVDTGGVIGKGFADTGEVIGKGLSDTGEVIGKGFTDTTSAMTGFFGFSSSTTSSQVTSTAATSTISVETSETRLKEEAAAERAAAYAIKKAETILASEEEALRKSEEAKETKEKARLAQEERIAAAAIAKAELRSGRD